MFKFASNRSLRKVMPAQYQLRIASFLHRIVAAAIVWTFSQNTLMIVFGAEIGRYRFDEGANGATAATILDTSTPGGNNGTAFGTPLFNDDIPISPLPQTGQPNQRSLEFDHFKTDYFRVNSLFPFHSAGDITLEFWLKVPNQGHAAIFWSRFNSAPNLNRFHIYLAGGFDNGPFAPLFLGMDYLDAAGANHQLLSYGIANAEDQPFIIEPGAWTHVGIVRAGNTYNFYKDGNFVWQTVDASPNLPNSVGWEVAGRTHDFSGRIDEIRFSDRALSPNEFLNAVPEPTGLVILMGGGLGLMCLARPQFRRMGLPRSGSPSYTSGSCDAY